MRPLVSSEFLRKTRRVALAESPRRLNLVLVGSYAWAATVLPAAWQSGHSAKGAAVLAYACLLVSIAFLRRQIQVAYALGIGGFVGFSCLCWALCGEALSPEKMSGLGGALGALGWLLFALSWGVVRRAEDVPEEDPLVIRAEPLSPRRVASNWALPVVFGVTLIVSVPWLLAWGGDRVPQTLLAHASALAFFLASLWVVGELVTSALRQAAPTESRKQFAQSVPALAFAATLAMLGLLYVLLRAG